MSQDRIYKQFFCSLTVTNRKVTFDQMKFQSFQALWRFAYQSFIKISLIPAVYTNTPPHANAHKPKMTHVCYRISYPHHISPGQGESSALVSFYFLILFSSSQSLFYPWNTRYICFFLKNKKQTNCDFCQTNSTCILVRHL